MQVLLIIKEILEKEINDFGDSFLQTRSTGENIHVKFVLCINKSQG